MAGTTYRIRSADWALIFDAGNVVLNVQRILPVVSITAQDAAASELPDTGTFRISRTGDTTLPLDVSYTVGGTTTAADYVETLTGTATIPAGAAFVDVTITPVNDTELESAETVTLTLAANANYTIDSTPPTKQRPSRLTITSRRSASHRIPPVLLRATAEPLNAPSRSHERARQGTRVRSISHSVEQWIVRIMGLGISRLIRLLFVEERVNPDVWCRHDPRCGSCLGDRG
ncbi:MAG: hypothetical protein U0670_08765 [Anaerolineae bacterium]